MQRILFISLFLLFYSYSFSQNCKRQTVCQTDTILLCVFPEKTANKAKINSGFTYKVLNCSKITIVGLRIEIGVSQYYYNASTRAWLGNHGGPSIGFILPIGHWNLGFRFKPWTVNPNKNLEFKADTLSESAKLNPVKLDYFIGYSFDFKYNLSVEPFIGYSKTVFEVINEDELQKKFAIPSASGLICGISLNKYFQVKEGKYISVFTNIAYSFVDYSITHTTLGVGYSEWTVGIAFKGFFKREFYKRI